MKTQTQEQRDAMRRWRNACRRERRAVDGPKGTKEKAEKAAADVQDAIEAAKALGWDALSGRFL